jgi:uncharacterized surface protein with fasciclin (FAS1) repeats
MQRSRQARHFPRPKEDCVADLVDRAQAVDGLTHLVTALQLTGLDDVLRGPGPFTLLAPSADAFAALPTGMIDALLADVPQLTQIVAYHIVPGRYDRAELARLAFAPTLHGQSVAIATPDDLRIGGARVVAADLEADNGMLQVIDRVLLPPSLEPTT